MRRILFLSNAGSIHTRRWAEHYRDRAVSVHIASFQPGRISGVSVHQLSTRGLGRVGYGLAVPSVRALARRVQPDVVHAHYVTSYGVVAALARLHPLVMTAWGSDVLINPQQSVPLRWLTRYALGNADAITTVAQHMNPAITALGIEAGRVHAVPFGVDARVFVLGSQLSSLGSVPRIICTRNFESIYDIGTLIRAVKLVTERKHSLYVDLVGRGSLRAELENQVVQSGLTEVCAFQGHVEPASLVKLLGRANVFVSPAMSDGNNVSLTEAMACGCFPIATAIPANAQWVEHGMNGLLFPPGDAEALAVCIQRSLDDAGMRERARQINREIIEQRASWQVCVRQMDEVYDEVINRCGTAE